MGERLNGIQEVRGSIPLASIGTFSGLVTFQKTLVAGIPSVVVLEAGIELLIAQCWLFAGIAQLVEHNLAKVGVAGSNPVSRSI